MDQNTQIVISRLIEILRDICLVALGAIATYWTQKRLSQIQRKKETENKEEGIILEAVTFLSALTDQVIKFWSDQDFKALTKVMDEGFFVKLKVISFQLRRLKDNKIWERFQKAADLSMAFSNMLQGLNLGDQQIDMDRLKKKREEWMSAEKEFGDYCVKYLELKK